MQKFWIKLISYLMDEIEKIEYTMGEKVSVIWDGSVQQHALDYMKWYYKNTIRFMEPDKLDGFSKLMNTEKFVKSFHEDAESLAYDPLFIKAMEASTENKYLTYNRLKKNLKEYNKVYDTHIDDLYKTVSGHPLSEYIENVKNEYKEESLAAPTKWATQKQIDKAYERLAKVLVVQLISNEDYRRNMMIDQKNAKDIKFDLMLKEKAFEETLREGKILDCSVQNFNKYVKKMINDGSLAKQTDKKNDQRIKDQIKAKETNKTVKKQESLHL